MRIENPVWLGTTALILALVAFQLGCQQASTPPAEESASGTLKGPEATAPTPPAPAPTPRASTAGQRAAARPPAPASQPAPTAARQPAAPPPRTATLAAGTPLKVRTTTMLSTKSHKTGDTFAATLEEPLVQGDWVIATKGATVEGRVVESDPGGRVKGVASLAIALDHLKTADGQTVDLSTKPVTVEAQSTKGKDAAKVAIGTGIGAAIGAIAGGKKGAAIGAGTGAGAGTAVVLSTRGDAAEIGSETVLNFELGAPVTVTEAHK